MRYDFDCRLLESLNGTEEALQRLVKTLCAVKEDHEISRFFLSHPCDLSHISIQEEALRLSHLEERLRAHLPSGIRIKLFSAVVLQDGVANESALAKLTRPCLGYLPVRLPLFPDTEMIDRELNILLYRRKILPLFLSFDRTMSVYPQEFVQKLLRIQGAAFAFSYASVAKKELQGTIKHLLSNAQPLLFGSGLRTPMALSQIGYTDFCTAQSMLSVQNQDILQDTVRRFWSA